MLSRETVVLAMAKIYRESFGQVFLGRWVCHIHKGHSGSVKNHSYLVTPPVGKQMGDLRGAAKLGRTTEEVVEI